MAEENKEPQTNPAMQKIINRIAFAIADFQQSKKVGVIVPCIRFDDEGNINFNIEINENYEKL